jgi:RimJ/RimL family protein N-acetyltransferase
VQRGSGRIEIVGTPIELSTSDHQVRLRPVRLDDAELLELWQSAEYRGEFNDFGIPMRPVRERIQEGGLVNSQGGTLIVEGVADRKPIGTVSWRQVRYGPNPEAVAWNIGIGLIPEARGHGFGTEAQRVLVEHLFATTPVQRIEATTDVDNVAEQRSLEKAGFQKEGVLRRAQYRPGGWHDLVIYACVRDTP